MKRIENPESFLEQNQLPYEAAIELFQQPLEVWVSTLGYKDGGMPISVPLWYLYDGEFIYMTVNPNSATARNLRRNKNVTLDILSVIDQALPIPRKTNVIVTAKAVLQPDTDNKWLGRISQQHLTLDQANERFRRHVLPDTLIVVEPTEVNTVVYSLPQIFSRR